MSDINQVPFNMAQLATWEDARHYANILSAGPIVVGLGHEVIAREIDVEDVGPSHRPVTPRRRARASHDRID